MFLSKALKASLVAGVMADVVHVKMLSNNTEDNKYETGDFALDHCYKMSESVLSGTHGFDAGELPGEKESSSNEYRIPDEKEVLASLVTWVDTQPSLDTDRTLDTPLKVTFNGESYLVTEIMDTDGGNPRVKMDPNRSFKLALAGDTLSIKIYSDTTCTALDSGKAPAAISLVTSGEGYYKGVEGATVVTLALYENSSCSGDANILPYVVYPFGTAKADACGQHAITRMCSEDGSKVILVDYQGDATESCATLNSLEFADGLRAGADGLKTEADSCFTWMMPECDGDGLDNDDRSTNAKCTALGGEWKEDPLHSKWNVNPCGDASPAHTAGVLVAALLGLAALLL